MHTVEKVLRRKYPADEALLAARILQKAGYPQRVEEFLATQKVSMKWYLETVLNEEKYYYCGSKMLENYCLDLTQKMDEVEKNFSEKKIEINQMEMLFEAATDVLDSHPVIGEATPHDLYKSFLIKKIYQLPETVKDPRIKLLATAAKKRTEKVVQEKGIHLQKYSLAKCHCQFYIDTKDLRGGKVCFLCGGLGLVVQSDDEPNTSVNSFSRFI